MKYCKKCDSNKDFIEFYKNKLSKDGYCIYCKKCDNKRKTILLRKKSKSLKKKQRYYTLDAKKDIQDGVKYCPGCKKKKENI